MKAGFRKESTKFGCGILGIILLCLLSDLKATLAPGAKPALRVEDPVSSSSRDSVFQSPKIDWVRPGVNTNALRWGIQGRLLWGLPPSSGKAPDGPRGLIRLYYPVLTNGGYDLLNFIAIEPVVGGRKGFSELEHSEFDDLAGKRLWPLPSDSVAPDAAALPAGELTRLSSGVESLTVTVRVEPFLNGAHLTLTITQRSDTPDEIQLAIRAEPDSALMEYCILTATMGNKARTRRLWLKDERVSSLELYPDYRGPDFTSHRIFYLDRLFQSPTGDILAAITTNEANPSAAPPPPQALHWRYAGNPVTQYWRKPAGTWRPDLHVAVNGRYTYWMSRHPIPGGIAFENFEMRERFYDGQQFNFGITRQSPDELGFNAAVWRECSAG